MSGRFWGSILEERNDWRKNEVAHRPLLRILTGPSTAAATAETQ